MLAIRARHDTVAVDALIHITSVVGYLKARPEEGLYWARHGQSIASRTPVGARRRAQLQNAIGSIHVRAGRLDRAAEFARRAEVGFESSPQRHGRRLADVRRWLEEHTSPRVVP